MKRTVLALLAVGGMSLPFAPSADALCLHSHSAGSVHVHSGSCTEPANGYAAPPPQSDGNVEQTGQHRASGGIRVTGSLCGLASVGDPSGQDSQAGLVTSGPVVVDDGAVPPTPLSGRILCSLQTNAPTHNGPVRMILSGESIAGVMSSETFVSYTAAPTDSVFLCSAIELSDGRRLYYDDATGTFGTSPDARCANAASVTAGDPALDDFLDALACPVVAVVLPPGCTPQD